MAESDYDERKPEAEEVPGGAAAPAGEGVEPDLPAATDFRRNLWLLVIILVVIVAAWTAGVLWKGMKEAPDLLGGSPPAPPPGRGPAPARAPRPQAPPPAQIPGVANVIGSGVQIIEAAPPMRLPSGDAVRKPQYFDVSRTADTFEMDQLIRLRGHWADQFLTLTPDNQTEQMFQPAAECGLLQDDERVISAATDSGPTAYPLRVFRAFVGVYGVEGGRPFCLVWNRPTQCARAFVALLGDRRLIWRDAGLNYRANVVLYDEQTGSLWDGFSGLALTGPSAGTVAEQLAIEVWPWLAWREANPDGRVLTATLGEPGTSLADAANEELVLAQYLRSPSLLAEPIHFKAEESPLPAKTFVLGISAGGASKAYPLQALAKAGGEPLEDDVGGVPVRVIVTSQRTARVEPAPGVTATVMLWFAWKDTHPETAVYEAAAAEGSAPAEETTGPAEPGNVGQTP